MRVKKGKSFIERALREEVREDLENNPIMIETQEKDILSFLRSLVVAYPKHDREFIDYRTEGFEKIVPWKSEVEIVDYLNEESKVYDDNPTTTSELKVIEAMKFLSGAKLVEKIDGEGWRISAKGALLLTIDTKNYNGH